MWTNLDIIPLRTRSPVDELTELKHTVFLPIRLRPIRSEIGLPPGWRFGDLGNLSERPQVERHAKAGAFVGVDFAVFEIQAFGQVRRGVFAGAVFDDHRAGER